MKTIKTGIFAMMLTLMGLSGSAHGQENGFAGNRLQLPLSCVRYDKERDTVDSGSFKFTLEEGSSDQFTGKIYYGGKLEQQVDDMVVKGHMADGRLVVGSQAYIFIELRLDERTGLGIFYNGLGQDVKCELQQ
jgi:hypothetical protein